MLFSTMVLHHLVLKLRGVCNLAICMKRPENGIMEKLVACVITCAEKLFKILIAIFWEEDTYTRANTQEKLYHPKKTNLCLNRKLKNWNRPFGFALEFCCTSCLLPLLHSNFDSKDLNRCKGSQRFNGWPLGVKIPGTRISQNLIGAHFYVRTHLQKCTTKATIAKAC